MNKLLGVDFGEKKIGIAISDDEGAFAFPNSIIPNTMGAVSHLARLVLENGIKKVVFGLSQNFEGKENPIMKEARDFSLELKKITNAEVVFQNESFSTVHARENNEGDVDAAAAALILQRYIDSHGNN